MLFYIIKVTTFGMYTIGGTSQKGNCIQFIGTEGVLNKKVQLRQKKQQKSSIIAL